MKRLFTLLVFTLGYTIASAAPPNILIGPKATHISRITADSLILITGSTYRFTVDTPEDQGLVSTGISFAELLPQLISVDGTNFIYSIEDRNRKLKQDAEISAGDRLIVSDRNGQNSRTYHIGFTKNAVGGKLRLQQQQLTLNAPKDLTLYFTAGQRSPAATILIVIPAGISVTMENTSVNVIGRGEVKLKDLSTQSIGRVGSHYSYSKVGTAEISKAADGNTILTFKHLDLRPANGEDLKIVIRNVKLTRAGKYGFKASYTTSNPETLTSKGIGAETATLTTTENIADLERIPEHDLHYKETADTYTRTHFKWTANGSNANLLLMMSIDKGKTWFPTNAKTDLSKSTATVSGLTPDKLYQFRFNNKGKAYSNTVSFYSGKMDIKKLGVNGDSTQDNTTTINKAIEYMHQLGGGTLLFSEGVYNVRTVHLKSNVFLYVDKSATIKALKGADAPETTWFSDKKYRSGLSPTDPGPYDDPENYLTKQDVGHHYFRNTMFFGERIDNVKIIGNGLITGNGNLVTGDKVMNNAPDNRADKMFTLKLCTNLEIGGIKRDDDLWYDPEKDEPYYIGKDGSRFTNLDNMLKIERAGHFVLLATGTDNINVHDTYFAKYNQSNVRDIYDFMGCNNVTATNIYSKVSSDDIIKPGSDCSLGFTRPAANYKVRNIIGDTNCNLFQIGSETSDDITDICVDNIYVLGANKAGFSISTNDGGHIKNIHLNCGHTGPLHSRSKMYRTTTPFFISISNRARILGADVSKYSFAENGVQRNELLVNNVNIGRVENIILNGIDIYEVYNGSSFSGTRWKAFDGSQKRATPIIAGYSLPNSSVVEGGLNFKLPNGKHTGYIENICFTDVHVLVKGGNPTSDTSQRPPELGVGQYNASNLKVQPSYGLWARHVSGLTIRESSFNFEKPDGRYAIFLEDVIGAKISGVKMARPKDNEEVIKLKQAPNAVIEKTVYYKDTLRNVPEQIAR